MVDSWALRLRLHRPNTTAKTLAPNDATCCGEWQRSYLGYIGLIFQQWENRDTSSIFIYISVNSLAYYHLIKLICGTVSHRTDKETHFFNLVLFFCPLAESPILTATLSNALVSWQILKKTLCSTATNCVRLLFSAEQVVYTQVFIFYF